MKLNLTGKMVAYFLVAVLISAIGFGLIYYNLQSLSDDITNAQQQELPRLEKSNEVAYNSMGQLASIRGFLVTGEDRYVQEFKKLADLNEKIEQDLVDTARTERLKIILSEIKIANDNYSAIVMEKVIPLKKAGRSDDAILVNRDIAVPAAQVLIDKVNNYKKERSEAANQALENASDLAAQSQKFVIITALIATLFGIGIGVFSARAIAKPVKALVEIARSVAGGNLQQSIEVKRQDEIGQLEQAFSDMVGDLRAMVNTVQDSAQQVAASSEELTASAEQSAQATNQIAASATDVARGTDQQVRAVDETLVAIEQMSAGIEKVASNANTLADMAVKADSAAHSGEESIDTAIQQMANIETTVNNSAQVVTKLGERSKEIGQIVDTISGIAGQTNLLALNAAIEAARAGEQGRGFAVVAEEVRKLAEQSQEAAKQIAALISEIQGETDKAVVAMDDGTREVKVGTEVVNTAGKSFNEITQLIDQVSAQVREASAALHQMAGSSEQVVASVRAIDKISKESAGQTQMVSATAEEQAASIEEMASSSQSLAKMAQDLQGVVSRFKV